MTQFLKLYPGEKDYKEVSEREWDVPLEFPDVNGWGNPLTLTADVRVWDRPGGKLLVAKKWQSKSFIRNMARIMRNFYSNSTIQLIDTAANPFTTQLNANGQGQAGLVPNRNFQFGTGAGVAVGDGVAILDHSRNDLVSRVGSVQIASDSVSTLVDSSVTLTFQITNGITIAQSGGITAREIALFLFVREVNANPTNVEGTPVLVGYDGITATPVAQGGVIAPRYTLNFPV
jgi:hypothetical protein